MQYARANYLRKVTKNAKKFTNCRLEFVHPIDVLSINFKKIHFATKIGIFEKMASETA